MISDYYDQDFTVEYESSTVKSALGSWKPSFTTVATFKGFMDMMNKGVGSNQVGAQWLDSASHIIGCSSTNSWIKPEYKIKDSDNNIYRVLHIDNPIRRNHHLEIYVEFHGSDMLST